MKILLDITRFNEIRGNAVKYVYCYVFIVF